MAPRLTALLLGASGTERWVRARGTAEQKEDGETTRLTGLLQDVTEQERGRQELEHCRKLTGRLLDAIDDFFFILDDERVHRGSDGKRRGNLLYRPVAERFPSGLRRCTRPYL